VEAIYYEDDLPEAMQVYTGENDKFFSETLPGREKPLASPGGAARLGPTGVDTPYVAGLAPRA
jgi:hypothetical protein